MKKLFNAILYTPKFTVMSWRYIDNYKDFLLGYRAAWCSFFGYSKGEQ